MATFLVLSESATLISPVLTRNWGIFFDKSPDPKGKLNSCELQPICTTKVFTAVKVAESLSLGRPGKGFQALVFWGRGGLSRRILHNPNWGGKW